ncbi:MAG: hypothetical protein COZ80_03880 [Ignavibacteria bacterium CG_4_8_14_3_um_filter_37_9]|nr:hypothetical protein [Ignavibacteria bacterium]OIO20874.1 MAG: hypothetical protein AUJ54_05145 [Ignavibacteria bacterium CG1_02_37_35]PIW99728.1 MAG: hypothetical protein COZ80_03880 [Ignavibacteria bacterium CG_4_8_14_3_um_filter_37_9]PIX94405.1 MAG: hypothetical protein COZ25_05845 [Ignavibacteria bacterium CG_4_10_14_3_um_filter_37_18]PJC59308.1 MAG: hypothetical protein CO025_06610 [Ignavibacteria bacterium CG_4_9_14_0_2_um_filter_37_13]
MFTQENLDQYIVKQVIVEVRHPFNLLFRTEARKSLNKFVDDVEKINITGNDDSFAFVNEKKYFKFVANLDHFGMTVENAESIETAEQLIKKYLLPISTELGSKTCYRFGVRVVYLYSFKDSFDNLVEIYKKVFYKQPNLFSTIGNIKDVGIIGLTLQDNNGLGINLSIGPFKKEEVKAKISNFKTYDDITPSSLMLDLDIFKNEKSNLTFSSTLHSFLEQSRIKAVQFREELFSVKE